MCIIIKYNPYSTDKLNVLYVAQRCGLIIQLEPFKSYAVWLQIDLCRNDVTCLCQNILLFNIRAMYNEGRSTWGMSVL